MKPIATVPRALRTVDVATGEAARAHHQRSDVCAVPAAGVVAEAMVALVLADAVLEKFGGDSVAETAATSRPTSPPSRASHAHLATSDAAPRRARRPAGRRARPPSGRRWPTVLGVPLRDTDAAIEAAHGPRSPTSSSTTASRTSASSSAPRSRAALAEEPGVLALGGGAVARPDTPRGRSRGRPVVFLDVGIADAVSASASTRPGRCSLGNPRASWKRLIDERRPLYERGRDLHGRHGGPHAPSDVAAEVAAAGEP